MDVLRKRKGQQEEVEAPVPEEVEVWYHEGPPALKTHRIKLAESSLAMSRNRLKAARIKLAKSGTDADVNSDRQRLHNKLRTFGNYASQVLLLLSTHFWLTRCDATLLFVSASALFWHLLLTLPICDFQVGDTRPLVGVAFSPDSTTLASASMSGLCKLWSVNNSEVITTLKGHNNRVGSVSWHPKSGISGQSLDLATADDVGKVNLWSIGTNSPVATLEHGGKRVAGTAFHPSGDYLGTTCHDSSWRLWDVETKTELLHQEGHSRAVHGGFGSIFFLSKFSASVEALRLSLGSRIVPRNNSGVRRTRVHAKRHRGGSCVVYLPDYP